MADTPAEFRVTKAIPGGAVSLFACPAHLAASMRQLQPMPPTGVALAVVPADPAVHSCKGCDADWPTG